MTITTILQRGTSTTIFPLAHDRPVTKRSALATNRVPENRATAVKESSTIMMTAIIGGETIVETERKTTTKVTVEGERRGNEESRKAVDSSN
jgi:hypothetical protein